MTYKARLGHLNSEEAEIVVDIGCIISIADRAFIKKHYPDTEVKIVPTII